MECPNCQTGNPAGQKFCGTCGRKLELECVHCGAPNPPNYKFCGQCGANLSVSATLALARSGLITRIDSKALELLGYREDELQGKPFSLFVERDDLVVFFSHWNEWINHSERKSFEIALKHKDGESVYLGLEFDQEGNEVNNTADFLIRLNETSNRRQVCSQLQNQEDLINLIFTVTNTISTVSRKHLDRSITDALKKICLFAEADRCFIYHINLRLKRLEPAYQWARTSPDQEDESLSKSVPLAMVKRAIVRLRQDKAYVVNDVAALAPSERYELLAWHQADLGGIACHLIYSGKRPVGVIGVAKNIADNEWKPNFVALVKHFGQMVSDKLPFAASREPAANVPQPPPVKAKPSKSNPTTQPSRSKVIDIKDKYHQPTEAVKEHPEKASPDTPIAVPREYPDMTRPMLIEKLSGRDASDQQPVFPRDDGLVLLTCPRCGLQESVSVNQFEKLGNAIHVNCSCGKIFTAVLEKRRSFRKPVVLDGHFTLKGDLGPADDDGSIWGPMVVKDLSKAGLRFSSPKSDLVHPGDLLMVRFHLDNSNQALINKPARVISVTGEDVGCRFEGDDSYDITLGFYFI